MSKHDAIDDLAHSPSHDDEAWLISYADLVTILMGFFVILFSMSTVDKKRLQELGDNLSVSLGRDDGKSSPLASNVELQRKRKEQDAFTRLVSIIGLSGEPSQILEQIKHLEEDAKRKKELQDYFAQSQEGSKVDVKRDAGSPELVADFVLPENLLFASGSDQIKPEALKDIQRVAATLSKVPGVVNIEVAGHTDSSQPSPNAKFSSNWSLSAARAGTVANELIKAGVDRDFLTVRGMADLEPLVHKPIAPENRRISLRITQLSGRPK